MFEHLSRWMISFVTKRAARSGVRAGAVTMVAAGLALASVGCGTYEPEPSFPDRYAYVAPTPPTAAELAAQQQARQQAAAESREVLIGADEGDEYADTDPSALTEFKPVLENHGTWIDDPSYGTVWVPSKEEVGADFQPYVTAGHWTYSEATDYVWVSDYSWGWAPFHYGRWVYLPGHGWSWIPGRRYAGAWVTWRVGPAGYGYVGWAPAPPSWYWHSGVAYGWSFGWYHHHDHYVYCPREHIHQPTLPSHVVRGPAAREHYGRTQDYIPASPGVGGGDRVVANPSVNGGGRIVANPTVGAGGRVPAKPGVGPRPEEIGLKNDMVVAPPASDKGLARARTFAAPSTAVAAGALPPAHLRPRAEAVPNVAGPPSRGPASATYVPGASRSFASPAPPANGALNDPARRYSASAAPSIAAPPVDRAPVPSPYRQPPSFSAATPNVTPPSSPSPSFRSSAPAVRSTPSFRSSSPSPSFRSSAPAVRSSPSVRATPSVRSAPAVRASPGIRRR